MEQRLFEDLIDSDVKKHKTQQAKVMPVAVLLHVLAGAAIIIVPILQSALLPESSISVFFADPISIPAPPPPPPPARRAARPMAARPVITAASFVAPVEIPQEIRPEEALDLGIDEGVAGGVAGGIPGGVVGGVVGGLPMATPPPQKAIRVGGQIKPPRKLKDVKPIYPDIAKQARVQGVVIVECTISPRGKVTDVKVLRGVPLLNQSAITAVRQWVYTPTLLNGVPVPVIMTVTVNFKLN